MARAGVACRSDSSVSTLGHEHAIMIETTTGGSPFREEHFYRPFANGGEPGPAQCWNGVGQGFAHLNYEIFLLMITLRYVFPLHWAYSMKRKPFRSYQAMS